MYILRRDLKDITDSAVTHETTVGYREKEGGHYQMVEKESAEKWR